MTCPGGSGRVGGAHLPPRGRALLRWQYSQHALHRGVYGEPDRPTRGADNTFQHLFDESRANAKSVVHFVSCLLLSAAIVVEDAGEGDAGVGAAAGGVEGPAHGAHEDGHQGTAGLRHGTPTISLSTYPPNTYMQDAT